MKQFKPTLSTICLLLVLIFPASILAQVRLRNGMGRPLAVVASDNDSRSLPEVLMQEFDIDFIDNYYSMSMYVSVPAPGSKSAKMVEAPKSEPAQLSIGTDHTRGHNFHNLGGFGGGSGGSFPGADGPLSVSGPFKAGRTKGLLKMKKKMFGKHRGKKFTKPVKRLEGKGGN